MVVKQHSASRQRRKAFESSVISYGSQTVALTGADTRKFESSVISYGSQTTSKLVWLHPAFESSVISYGSQTI